MLSEFWAYQYADDPKLDDRAVVDDDFDQSAIEAALANQDPDDPDFPWDKF